MIVRTALEASLLVWTPSSGWQAAVDGQTPDRA
jgi:hypothetical protein